MKGFFIGLILALILLAGAGYYIFKTSGYNFGINKNIFVKGTIDVSSQNFLDGGAIPKKFTCDGEGINPQLFLDRVPLDAKSLVLIVDDPTATPQTFNHWIVFNIDPGTLNIDAGTIPPGAIVGKNDAGKSDYSAPCPPIGTHNYYFRIYALDTVLSLDENATRKDIDRVMFSHIIAQGTLYGKYTK